MTKAISVYRERDTLDNPYYARVEDELWDNYHSLFLASGNNEESVALLLDINPSLNIFLKPERTSPGSIFRSRPHALILNEEPTTTREFYIENYLERHLGWGDKINPKLYDRFGFDVFLIEDSPSRKEWLQKSSMFGIEVFSLLDYQIWLSKFPGNIDKNRKGC